MARPVNIIGRGLADYAATFDAMREFTARRDAATVDELWWLEHPPVFTLGTNADAKHLLAPGDIPVVATDRGGQVTYHGPGQLVVYVLVDLKRARLGIRDLVARLESGIIGMLAESGIAAQARRGAPGVYVDGAKIASIGLRIRRHCSYHGISLNVDLDPEPFSRINPCGYPGLDIVNTATLGGPATVAQAAEALLPALLRELELEAQTAS
jgi:lipoyl(octanoyl) transferase